MAHDLIRTQVYFDTRASGLAGACLGPWYIVSSLCKRILSSNGPIRLLPDVIWQFSAILPHTSGRDQRFLPREQLRSFLPRASQLLLHTFELQEHRSTNRAPVGQPAA